MKLNLLGYAYEHSGYGKMAREYAKALYHVGVDVRFGPMTKAKMEDLGLSNEDGFLFKEICSHDLYNAITVEVVPPEVYHPSVSAVCNIGYCELETDKLPQEWVDHCNLMQEIWVPTAFFEKIARDSGVKVPITVIPQGINTKVFNPQVQPLPLGTNRRFKFFMNGEFISRKNFRTALEAFWGAFTDKDDVCFILKTYDLSDPKFEENIPKKIAEWKGSRKNTAPVFLINKFMPDKEIPRLYAAIDCLVHPASGEGWGFPPLEAAVMEKPVILTDWGAMNEIFADAPIHKLKYKLVDIPPAGIPNDRLFKGARWAKPDKDHLASLMRKAYEDHGESKELLSGIRQKLCDKWSWRNAALKMVKRVGEIEFEKKHASGIPVFHFDPAKKFDKPKVNISYPSYGRRCGIATYTESMITGLMASSPECMIHVNEEASEYDVLHLQFQYGLYSNILLNEMLGTINKIGRKIVVTMHDFGATAVDHNQAIKKYADVIVVHSEEHGDALVESGFSEEVIRLIPHGIDLKTYEEIKALKIKPVPGLIGYFGFLYDHKGLLELGLAMKELSKKGYKLRALSSLGVAARPSQLYWERVRKFFNREDLWKHIELYSRFMPKEELARLLAECEIIILPYEDYGQIGVSGAVREAMLAGRPMIVTDTPFFSDLDKEVYKIRNNDPDLIAAAVLNLSLHGQVRSSIKAAMEARIRRDSWENIGRQYAGIYKG